MSERTRLERRLIETIENVLDVSELHDVNSDEMAKEIRFARKVVEIWKTDGAERAADSALCGLMFARMQRDRDAVHAA